MSKSCCTSCVCVPSAVLYCREVLKQNIFRIQETDGLTIYISNLDYLILQKSYFKISKVSEIELQRYTDMKISELLYSLYQQILLVSHKKINWGKFLFFNICWKRQFEFLFLNRFYLECFSGLEYFSSFFHSQKPVQEPLKLFIILHNSIINHQRICSKIILIFKLLLSYDIECSQEYC